MARTLKAILDEIEKIPEFSYQKMAVKSKGTFGNYPIHISAAWGDKEAIEVLLKHGADINSVGAEGETPIFRAIKPKNEDFLRFLISHGARVDVTDAKGFTPLDIARIQGYKDILHFLEEFQGSKGSE